MAKFLGCFSVSDYYGMTALTRTVPGDSGERDEGDRKALEESAIIKFSFTSESRARFWLITESDRHLKMILLAG